MTTEEHNFKDNNDEIIDQFLRYFSFWPYFIVSLLFFLISSYIYIRYTNPLYETTATIEIIDKAQDSEMVLPSAMTIFNRSLINLENEIGVLNSRRIHQNVVRELKYNIKYFNVGTVKETQMHISSWNDFEIEQKIDSDTISFISNYTIEINTDELIITEFFPHNETEFLYKFQGANTKTKSHKLPFEFSVKDQKNNTGIKKIQYVPVNLAAEEFLNFIDFSQSGTDSDQILISFKHSNKKISQEYINELVKVFDLDGIEDRRLEYKRTIDFVDTRSKFLEVELEKVELSKQEYKVKNNLSNISADSNININQKVEYNQEIFKARAQKDLANILIASINNEDYDLMPVNIGIDNENINSFIGEYNLLVNLRSRYLLTAGTENFTVKSTEDQLDNLMDNIINSLNTYVITLDKTISNLESKELEFEKFYSNVPEKEKILRSIERELEVKEALFLLLLQKREEAAINYAVIKPSIKVIDLAISSKDPISPNKKMIVLFALISSFVFPVAVLFVKFESDTKIQTKEQIIYKTDVPVIAEIPNLDDKYNKSEITLDSLTKDKRGPLSESIRMIVASLNFLLKNFDNNKKSNVIIITSSVKGEGKTLISTQFSNILSERNNKVILIGTDLRNPQIHRYLNIDKNFNGLADLIYDNDVKVDDVIIKHNNLDIILSGAIPPNPTTILSSDKFKNLINDLKKSYDYIILDTAPCLLVSDTFELSNLADLTLYVVRSNHSEKSLLDFIEDCNKKNKMKNMNIVFNAVGANKSYDYKYSYGYKYAYNYGYGYGYESD